MVLQRVAHQNVAKAKVNAVSSEVSVTGPPGALLFDVKPEIALK